MVHDDEGKWCIGKGPGEPVVVKFKLCRPIWFRGYGLRMANDCPERDPRRWEVKVDNSMGKVTHFTDEDVHQIERHNSFVYGELERFATYKFAMKFPVFTDEIEFTFTDFEDPEVECF